MSKRIFIVHGWADSPDNGWYPWIKEALEKEGFHVTIPVMPDPKKPTVNAWVGHLREVVDTVDAETYFIGHSIGCQTILRYLETLPDNTTIGGMVFVGGWTQLSEESYERDEDREVAKPWLDTPLSWNAIRSHVKNVVAIFSDNDPYVPLSDVKVFEEQLHAKSVLEHKKGHLSGYDGITELPSVLDAVRNMQKKL